MHAPSTCTKNVVSPERSKMGESCFATLVVQSMKGMQGFECQYTDSCTS